MRILMASLLAALLGCAHHSYTPDEQLHHFFWPISGDVFQGFYGNKISGEAPGLYYDEGDQVKVFGGPGRMHRAIDIDTSAGTKVQAAKGGTVARYDWDGTALYGNRVVINHGGGYWTLYAHLESISVLTGQAVKLGDVIGKVGSTGNSTGPHLHFEIRHSPSGDTLDSPHFIPGNAGDSVSKGDLINHSYPGAP